MEMKEKVKCVVLESKKNTSLTNANEIKRKKRRTISN